MNQEEYNKNFKEPEGYQKAALKQALDIRKFEIELYWKRATYFWTFIAVMFAGYFAIVAANPDNMSEGTKFFLSLIVACIGFVFTFAWYLANRGNKYWQENWEAHVDLLEDDFTGPLYKTHVTEIPENTGKLAKLDKFLTGSRRVSVSKINLWVNIFVMAVWFLLIFFSNYKSLIDYSPKWWSVILLHLGVIFVAVGLMCCKYKTRWINIPVMLIIVGFILIIPFFIYKSSINYDLKQWSVILLHFGVIIVAIVFCGLMWFTSKTDDRAYEVEVTRREVKISE